MSTIPQKSNAPGESRGLRRSKSSTLAGGSLDVQSLKTKTPKPPTNITPEMDRRIKELCSTGLGVHAIAVRLGISNKMLLSARRRLGLKLNTHKIVTPELENRIKELWSGGLGKTVAEISVEIGFSSETVFKILRKLGLPTRRAARVLARRSSVSGLAGKPKGKGGYQKFGQTTDDTFSWISKACIAQGVEASAMEEWRQHAAEYIQFCHGPNGPAGFSSRLFAIGTFLRHYLIPHRFTEPKRFFMLPLNVDLPLLMGPPGTAPFRKTSGGVSGALRVCDWLDWVLDNKYSSDEEGPRPDPFPNHRMPFVRPGYKGIAARADTSDKNALPFHYIRKLRAMLAEGPNFSDWKWAQNATGAITGRHAGDWFRVDESLITNRDPDCVVRKRRRLIRNRENHPQHPYDPKKSGMTIVGYEPICEMWSPVAAVALLVKLEMPFRTFQVRMLDSGECDQLRPEIDPDEEALFLASGGEGVDTRQAAGHPLFSWRANGAREKLLAGLSHNDALRVKGARGVFAKYQDKDIGEYVGFFINTNKTADIGVPEQLRGYYIRWQHHSLHRWLIKLRNWQEKYNPIGKPTLWTELEAKHFGQKKAFVDLAKATPTCFLFRDASNRGKSTSEDTRKPIQEGKIGSLWAKLLDVLEKNESRPGVRPPGAPPLLFVKSREDDGFPVGLYYPLHALRVSLITGLAEGGMKLETLMHLAGHTRLVMTIYYIKQSAFKINGEMREAAKRQATDEAKQTQAWLLNQPYENLPRYVIASEEGLRASIPRNPKERSAVQFERHLGGWCLMGGNVAQVPDNRQIGGCFNGGHRIGESKVKHQQQWASVRPKACIEERCRWFVTRPGFILEIRARMDLLATNLSLAQERRDKAELAVRDLEAEFHRAEVTAEAEKENLRNAGKTAEAASVAVPWNKQDELDKARQWEDRAAQEVHEILAGIDNGARLVDDIFALVAREAQAGAATSSPLIAQGSPADVTEALSRADSGLLSAAKLSVDTEVHFSLTVPKAANEERAWSFEPVSELEQLSRVCFNAVDYPELESASYGPLVRRTQAFEQALENKGFDAKFARLPPEVQLRLVNNLMEEMAGPFGGNLSIAIKHLEGSAPLPSALEQALNNAIASGAYETVRLGKLMAPSLVPPRKVSIK